MQKRYAAFFIILFMICWASNGTAQSRVYIVGVENLEYMPYYSGAQNSYTGFTREILDMFAADQGITFKYKPEPVKRLFGSFLNKKVDLKFPDNPYWQSDMKKGHKIMYSQPVIDYIDGVMVLPANKGRGVDQLKRLGTVRGFTPWDYIDRIKAKTIVISENDSFTGLLKQTLKKRVDGAYINPVVARFHLEKSLNNPRLWYSIQTCPIPKAPICYQASNIRSSSPRWINF